MHLLLFSVSTHSPMHLFIGMQVTYNDEDHVLARG